MFHKELVLNIYRTYPKITYNSSEFEQTQDQGHVKSMCLYDTLGYSDTKDNTANTRKILQ